MRPTWAPEGLPGGVWAAWGPLGALLGLSWVVLGAPWRAPGASWSRLGGLGPLLGPPGARLGLIWASRRAPFGTFWASVEGALAKSRKPRNSLTVQHFLRFFEVPGPPKSLSNRFEIAPRRVWAPLEASWGLVGLSEASLGPSVGRLRGSWAVPGWLQTGRDAPQLAHLTSPQVQHLSGRQVMN